MAGVPVVPPGGHRIGLAATVAAAGGLLFGYDTGVISGALLFVTPEFGLDDIGQQVLVGGLLAGALVGALIGGVVSDALGRRRTLLGVSVLFGLGALLSGAAPDVLTLVVARVLLGLSVGVSSVCVPLYIAELAPRQRRGRLVSMNQFMITVGILASYVVNFAFQPAQSWRWPLALAVVPALAMLLGLLRTPESPRWLVLRGRPDEAAEALRAGRTPEEARTEIAEIAGSLAEESRWTWADVWRPPLRPALTLSVGVAATSQLVGVNAVVYYAPTILQRVVGSDAGAVLATVGIGAVNVLVTFVALSRIDSWGRRPLLLGGLGALIAALVALVVLFLLPGGILVGALIVVALCVYIAAFAAGLGIAIWLVNSEVFPTAVRGKAGGIGATTHWGLDLVIASTTLTLITYLGESGLFAVFAVIGVAGFAFLFRVMPETKGKSLEQVDAELRARVRRRADRPPFPPGAASS